MIYLRNFYYYAEEHIHLYKERLACINPYVNYLGKVERPGHFGYLYDSEGNLINDSAGFCCYCPKNNDWHEKDTSAKKRGDCLKYEGGSSAHCLRFSPIEYQAYKIRDFYYFYEITIKVDYKVNEVQYTKTEVLSPSKK